MMTAKQFQPYLDRDDAHCYSCGTTEGLVPQHRINRGAGGRKSLDIPSNILTFCGICNGDLEADADRAQRAREYGWKLSDGEQPYLLVRPVYDRWAQQWFWLDDAHHRTAVA